MTPCFHCELAGPDLFRFPAAGQDYGRLYGGRTIAQALLAAGKTVTEDRIPHSLHGYFLRGGDPAEPIDCQVERDRDGRSYSARRVVARQHGQTIFTLSASFQSGGNGPTNITSVMPDVADPADLVDLDRFKSEGLSFREVEETSDGAVRVWIRADTPLPTDPLSQAVALSYISDKCNGIRAFTPDGTSSGPSVDHALWIHRLSPLTDWVLLELIPGNSMAGRGWYRGSIFTEQGELLATLAQETLLRWDRRPQSGLNP